MTPKRTTQKRCIGLIADSNRTLVQCPELVPSSWHNQRKYHSRTCKYRTWGFRKRGFSAGDKLLLPPKPCTGWALQDGIIVVCGKLFTPSRPNKRYHSKGCHDWMWRRCSDGLALGDIYVKGKSRKQHPPKSCVGWTIRDGVIAKCAVPFTGSGNKEYHSTACLFRTRRWRALGYHLNDSVRRTCAYRNCHKGEGGARKTFDRIHRSLRSGDYFCDRRCGAAEQRARQAEKVEEKLAEAKAEIERLRPKDPGRPSGPEEETRTQMRLIAAFLKCCWSLSKMSPFVCPDKPQSAYPNTRAVRSSYRDEIDELRDRMTMNEAEALIQPYTAPAEKIA